MKVKELINILQNMDENADVCFTDNPTNAAFNLMVEDVIEIPIDDGKTEIVLTCR